ncbi:MAG TPA: 30S ribosomal protein S20 [Fimbriimonadaceae bacterium]|nr:30S ribosomal protein S20 [Fimbriimonadaceae bacterium]
MANKRSSKKDLRRIAKRRVRNQGTRTSLKTFVKKVKTATPANVEGALVQAVKALDKAAQRGIIHKNAAARRKSRAAKAANKVAAK